MVNLPPELRMRWKVYAALRGEPMADMLVEALEAWVNKQELSYGPLNAK